jgi:anti-anti-sigma factor
MRQARKAQNENTRIRRFYDRYPDGPLMQITQHPAADSLELRLTGRIDATWAEHLSKNIENAIRAGSHHIVLNFAGVDYISSLGIRVLVVQYKLLKAVKGTLGISHPNEFCRNVLTTVGLSEMLVSDQVDTPAAPVSRRLAQTLGGAAYEVYPQSVARPLSCVLTGDPRQLASGGFSKGDCRPITFATGSFGLGLGAFGEGFEECSGRFGEFLAAGGCAIAMPTNESHALPDFVVEQGGLVPRVETLYALTGKGDFSAMVRFDALPSGPGKIPLSELVLSLIELAQGSAIGFVVLAEAAGLVGANLLKSPARHAISHTLPDVRDWLSFTSERTAEKSLCLLVGIAGTDLESSAAPFVRPLNAGSPVQAHIHAASFPYRAVPRGELPFGSTIAGTLSASTPNAVLHLMADTRPFEGVGETDLARGACWIGPISTITRG